MEKGQYRGVGSDTIMKYMRTGNSESYIKTKSLSDKRRRRQRKKKVDKHGNVQLRLPRKEIKKKMNGTNNERPETREQDELRRRADWEDFTFFQASEQEKKEMEEKRLKALKRCDETIKELKEMVDRELESEYSKDYYTNLLKKKGPAKVKELERKRVAKLLYAPVPGYKNK
jgi:hypothetical protein